MIFVFYTGLAEQTSPFAWFDRDFGDLPPLAPSMCVDTLGAIVLADEVAKESSWESS